MRGQRCAARRGRNGRAYRRVPATDASGVRSEASIVRPGGKSSALLLGDGAGRWRGRGNTAASRGTHRRATKKLGKCLSVSAFTNVREVCLATKTTNGQRANQYRLCLLP